MDKTKKPKLLEVKKVKLSFKVDEPTITGRIYKRGDLNNAFREELDNKRFIPVVRNSSSIHDGKFDYSDLIGKLMNFEIMNNGEVILHIKPIIETELFDCFQATTSILGIVNKDNTVEICKLLGFFLATKNDKILEK